MPTLPDRVGTARSAPLPTLRSLIILLTGGTKRRQQRDIDAAHASWQDYKQSKRARR